MQILTNLNRLIMRNTYERIRRNNEDMGNEHKNNEHKKIVLDEPPNVDEDNHDTPTCEFLPVVGDDGNTTKIVFHVGVQDEIIPDGADGNRYCISDQEEERPIEEIIHEQIELLLKEKTKYTMDSMKKLREYYLKMQTKSDEPLIPLVCKNCGSPLEYHKGMDTLKCKYCDTEFLINK